MTSLMISAAALAALLGVSGQSVTGPTLRTPRGQADASVQAPSRGCTANHGRRVMFVNDTEKAIRKIILTNPNVTGSERVLEGADVPVMGGSMPVEFDDPGCVCVYDITVEFNDDTTRMERRFNACARWEWNVSGKREAPTPRY